ncbi:hypothetical protein EMPS_00973 [Entomortierella parvispora]|uniref:Adhesin domain-containing protein n=1 Tax=Entomortierella parvispora TaxID=205924 RepID=A0A9P3H2Q3_9FUNG|nr:hypothetical protein EMPS_00973 [Entomortierella parvispora]
MGIFQKPLLPARYDNEDVQISAEFCSNIAINVVGLAKGEITILSGNEDMIQIKTSVQARESILKNAAALEPFQDGDQYSYTIHTPMEEKLEKAVTFQVFITIPRNLDALESFTIHGTNVELAIGNINHTFIRTLDIQIGRGEISIDSFYGETATVCNTITGSIQGKYSVARLIAQAKSGRIKSTVHLLNTDDQLPPPKVIVVAQNNRVDLNVDGSDLFGPFTVESKTQTAPLDVKILLASVDQRLLGNFINFGGPVRVRMSGNYQGRIETRTHYGKIYLDEPEFVRLEGAMLTMPSASDRNACALMADSHSQSSQHSGIIPSRSSSNGTTMSWGEDHHPHHHSNSNGNSQHILQKNGNQQHVYHQPPPQQHQLSQSTTSNGSGPNSRPESTNGSFSESRSIGGTARSTHGSSPSAKETSKREKQRRREEEKESSITRELIGMVGQGPGLVMIKNSSGDIHVELI